MVKEDDAAREARSRREVVSTWNCVLMRSSGFIQTVATAPAVIPAQAWSRAAVGKNDGGFAWREDRGGVEGPAIAEEEEEEEAWGEDGTVLLGDDACCEVMRKTLSSPWRTQVCPLRASGCWGWARKKSNAHWQESSA